VKYLLEGRWNCNAPLPKNSEKSLQSTDILAMLIIYYIEQNTNILNQLIHIKGKVICEPNNHTIKYSNSSNMIKHNGHRYGKFILTISAVLFWISITIETYTEATQSIRTIVSWKARHYFERKIKLW
jgi:hypothetical protein